MQFVSIILGIILLTGSGLANAGVWYQWHATNNAAPHGISLLLEFDHAAIQNGAFQMQIDIDNNNYATDTIFPQSGLLSLRYSTGTGGAIHWNPREGITSPGPVLLNMSVTFNPGNHLTGHIYAHNFDSQFGMATGIAGSPHFTIYEAESDAGMNGCGWTAPNDVPCSGATGQIRRIPEPASTALLGLGVLGMLVTRRRSGKQKAR